MMIQNVGAGEICSRYIDFAVYGILPVFCFTQSAQTNEQNTLIKHSII